MKKRILQVYSYRFWYLLLSLSAFQPLPKRISTRADRLCSPTSMSAYSAIMTFDEVEDELFKLEKRSKDLIQVDIAGYTLEGRPFVHRQNRMGFKKNVDPGPYSRK